jgi:hypothetical protein
VSGGDESESQADDASQLDDPAFQSTTDNNNSTATPNNQSNNNNNNNNADDDNKTPKQQQSPKEQTASSSSLFVGGSAHRQARRVRLTHEFLRFLVVLSNEPVHFVCVFVLCCCVNNTTQ